VEGTPMSDALQHLRLRWESEPDLAIVLAEREDIRWWSMPVPITPQAIIVLSNHDGRFKPLLTDAQRHAYWKSIQYVKKADRG
jgi:hypothetical protein